MTVRAKSSGWLQAKIVFWTQQNIHTHELTKVIKTFIGLEIARQNLSMEKGYGH